MSVEGKQRKQSRGLPGHGLTFWPLDTGMLVVAEEEAFSAVAFIAAHHINTALLTATVAFSTLVHICSRQVVGGAMRAASKTGTHLRAQSIHTSPLSKARRAGLRQGAGHPNLASKVRTGPLPQTWRESSAIMSTDCSFEDQCSHAPICL